MQHMVSSMLMFQWILSLHSSYSNMKLQILAICVKNPLPKIILNVLITVITGNYYIIRYYYTQQNYFLLLLLHIQTFSGDYIGPACGICNRERQTCKKLTIVFHNFKSYDVHLLVEDLAKHEPKLSDVKIIPQSMEKYTSIVTNQFRYTLVQEHGVCLDCGETHIIFFNLYCFSAHVDS